MSLMETIRQNPDLNFLNVICHSGYIAENFNKIVKLATENLCSHIFFVEHDMVFPADTVKKLLAHDKDIVGAMYNYRTLPKTSTTGFYGKDGKTTFEVPEVNGLTEVVFVATGCTLIKTDVFLKISKPYFPMEQDQDGNRILTQDVGLCEKAREVGYKIYVDPDIEVGHIGDYIY